MTSRRNLITTLTALRPRTTVTRDWPQERRDTTLHQIMADTWTPTKPATRRWAPRVIVVTLAVGLAIPAGLSIAAATGYLPDAFVRNYADWQTDANVDPATATRVASGPGPDGKVFTVWTARGANGMLCVAPMFESPDSAASPAPSAFEDTGSYCAPTGRVTPLGDSRSINADEAKHVYHISAGDTVRAEVRLHDGTVLPALRVDGYYVGWYPTARGVPAPVLTAYDIAGHVSGTVPLRYLT